MIYVYLSIKYSVISVYREYYVLLESFYFAFTFSKVIIGKLRRLTIRTTLLIFLCGFASIPGSILHFVTMLLHDDSPTQQT